MNKDRNLQQESSQLRNLVSRACMFELTCITIFFYMFFYVYIKIAPSLNIYLVGIFAGLTGGFWGIGLDDAYSFSMWARYGNDFHKRYNWVNKNKDMKHWIQAYPTEESFLANLRFWQKRFKRAFILTIIIGVIAGSISLAFP